MADQYLSPQEVADELKVGIRVIYDLLRSNRLKSVKLGHRTIRIKRSDFDAYVAERETNVCR